MADLHTCTHIRLPPELQAKADMLAIEVNPANGHQITMAGTPQNGGTQALSIALPIGSKWRNGSTLRVRILNGSGRIKTRIRQHATVWTEHANITFDFVDSGDAEIRVNIDSSNASWSCVGTDSLSIPKTRPTMNLGGLTDWSSESEFSHIILHEFGHALGCIHEHQSPAAGIPWNKEVVYEYYAAMGWSRTDVNRNLFEPYATTTTQYSSFDTASIMLYPIPASLTTNGFSVGWNTELSEMDKKFIAREYPPKEAVKRKIFPIPCNSPPTFLAVGLNYLDIKYSARIRVNAFTDNTTPLGTNVHINTWADTTLYSAGCTWFPSGSAVNDPDFQLKTSRSIVFERAYASPPKVVVWLNQLDMVLGKNWRVAATATGFTLHLDTWADTRLYFAAAAWIAYPSNKAGVFSGSYSTGDVPPQLANSGRVDFPRGGFRRAPTVLVALNSLDIDARYNLRVRLGADSVSKDGLNWHIDSWADTILYSAGAS